MLSSAEATIKDKVEQEAKQQAGNAFVNELKAEAQAGNLKTVLVLGAIGGVVAGVAYTGLKWHQHKEKEHLRQAELAEKNHTQYLTRIKVSDTEEIDLPSIFMRDAKTGVLYASKDYKSIAELRKMVNERSSINFPPKAEDSIMRAIRLLLDFYEGRLDRWWFKRGEEGDVTAAFLRYHICRLFEYGKKFQGTQYTSAILNCIHDSLNQFSVEHGETSERRSYLDLACRALKSAVTALEQYKQDRTLADLVAEATPECDELAVKLMHNLTKLVTPTKNWKYIDRCVDPKLLEQGFVKKEVANGKLGTHPKAILLHSSPVGQNIKKIAKNYNEAKCLSTSVNQSTPNARNNKLKTSGFTQEEQQQNKTIFTEQRISNFMTTTSRFKNIKTESGETVSLTEKDEKYILDRLDVLYGLAELNNDDVLIIKLFLKLQRYAKEKGDEFIANPANAHYMFDVLLALGSTVRKQATICENGLRKVEQDHELKTLVPEQALLLTGIKQLVVAIREEVESSIKAIKNYRTQTHYEMLEEEVKVHEHETLQLFADIAEERGLNLSQPMAAAPTDSKIQPPAASNGADPGPLQGGSGAVITTALAAAAAIPAEVKAEITLENLDHILANIHALIIQNSKEEMKRPYERIHAALTVLREQYAKMHGSLDSDRRLKAVRTKNLAYELCQFTLAFLQRSVAERRAGFTRFTEEMDAKINDPANAFMDEHFGRVGRYLSDHKDGFSGLFYFDPDTRKEFKQVSVACHRLGSR